MDGVGSKVQQPHVDARHRAAPRRWIYENLTPWRIYACFDAEGHPLPPERAIPNGNGCAEEVVKVLAIPALGETAVPAEDACGLNTLNMRRLGQIEVRPAPSELLTNLPRAIVIFGWLAVGLCFGAWALFFGGAGAVPWAWVVATVVLVPVIALLVATFREIRLYLRFRRYRAALCEPDPGGAPGDRRSVEGIERGSRIRSFLDGVPRQAAEVAVLIGAVLVSVIGLGVAIHQTTQLNELLPIDYGAIFQLDNPFGDVGAVARESPAFWQLLVGHVAQWILVSVAALAPAAMYFQFDRQRLAAVQRRWVQEVFRLDPTVRTVRDIEAKYGSQIEASFGDLAPDSGLRLRSGRRSPVIVATILLVVGWFLVISTTKVPPLDLSVGPRGAEYVWSQSAGEAFPVSTFFRPSLSLIGYAFLGAYVFTLFHVIRGYHRRDLHPKTYNTIVVRILAAYAMALVVGVVYSGPAAEVLMFFVGFMPQSALVWLREKLSQSHGVWKKLPLDEPAPLTELEGIDLYDRTRLAEEGINNIEALAHADLVDLMSSTRISAAELVDWTDQAILYLRVGGDTFAKRARDRDSGAAVPGVTPPDVRENLCHLRHFGIRTATDLIQVYKEALRRGGTDPARRRDEVELLRDALDLPNVSRPTELSSIQAIIDTLPDEEWFVQVHNWRTSEFGAVDAWYRYLDGRDWTPRRMRAPKRVKQAMRPLESVPMIA
jgi:hypothetical protein